MSLLVRKLSTVRTTGALVGALEDSSGESAPMFDHTKDSKIHSRRPTQTASVETTRDYWNADVGPAEPTCPLVSKPTPAAIKKYWNTGFEELPSPLSRQQSGLPSRDGPQPNEPCQHPKKTKSTP